MTQTYSAASIYGLIDRMDDAAIRAWLDFHRRLKHPSRFINVFTAAKFDQGPSVLRQVRDSLPNTIPVWRGYDGKDAWGNIPPAELAWDDSNFYLRLWNTAMTSARMAAGLWFNRRVQPHLKVIRETGAIIHLLNEATPVFNAAFEMECIRLLGEEGIRAGGFAWTAGTPDWPDYQQQAVIDAVAMAEKYNTVVMTHEYSGIRQVEQNSLINRNAAMTKLFKKQPDVFLGEFALAKATIKVINGQAVIILDPGVGWRDMGVTVPQYFGFIGDTAKTWYIPNKVAFSIYSGADWGVNGSFGVMKYPDLLDLLVDASAWMCFDVEESMQPATPIVLERPPEAKIGLRAKIKSIPAEFRNLRADHNYTALKTGEVAAGDIVKRYDIPAYDGPVSAISSGKWIFCEKLVNDTVVASGWLWRDRIIWESTGATQEIPTVPPVEIPPPPQETLPPPPTPAPVPDPAQDHAGETPTSRTTKMAYSFEIETTPEMHANIEKYLMGIVSNLIYFGQAMTGAGITLVTEVVK